MIGRYGPPVFQILRGLSGAYNVALMKAVPSSGLLKEYLYYLLQESSIQTAVIAQSQRAAGQSGVQKDFLENFKVLLPPLVEQQRIAVRLRDQLAAAKVAASAIEAQLVALREIPLALTREDTSDSQTTHRLLGEVLEEVTVGIGESWRGKPALGATRAGLAPAKEGVGKQPHRYKPVTPGTVFYNPMRILLGSIALVDDNDTPGITSPDYVVVCGRERVLHPVWFYYWFRSSAGAEFIQSLTRGAVRERLLFNRLAVGRIPVPSWSRQIASVERVRAAEKARISFAARLKVLQRLPAALLREAFGAGGQSGETKGISDLASHHAMAADVVT
jgi:type I restriction enzyme S subunit